MTAPLTSTIPAAKAKLVELLSGRDFFVANQIPVLYSWTAAEHQDRVVYLDPADTPLTADSDEPVMRGGRRSRDERYPIIVAIRVAHTEERTAAEAEAETFLVLAELENLLADNSTLDQVFGADGRATYAGHSRVMGMTEGNRWHHELKATVTCRSRLS